MLFIGRVTQGAVCALVLLTIGTVLADNKTKATWSKCSESNSERVLGALPDTDVQELYLSSCQLTTLQPGDFRGLPNLKELTLTENNLNHVDTIVFKDLNNLTTLSFYTNQMKQMPNFGENPGVLPKLDMLQIDDNQIEQLDNPKALSTLTKLEVFGATKNRIEYIHEDMFKNLPLVTIYLFENKLKYIPAKLFQVETLQSLFLNDNLLEYIPKDSFRGSAITELHIHGNRLTYLQDNFLSQFPGGKLQSIRFEKNSWQCSKLRELFLDITRAGITDYNPAYYNGTHIMCVVPELKTMETISILG